MIDIIHYDGGYLIRKSYTSYNGTTGYYYWSRAYWTDYRDSADKFDWLWLARLKVFSLIRKEEKKQRKQAKEALLRDHYRLTNNTVAWRPKQDDEI